MAASVWIRSTSGAPVEADPGIWRCSPEMMPDVTGPRTQRAAHDYGEFTDLRQRFLKCRSGQARTVGSDHRDVGRRIGGANCCRHLLPVGEGYGDGLHAGDHVGISDDCAVRFIDNAAAHAALGEHCDDRGLDLSDQCR